MTEQKKLAVVLFNLGGPDGPDAVGPFLFNLFNDRAIIDQPQPLRWLLAKFIASRRATVAKKIYAEMGGGSPIVAETEAQAAALERAMKAQGLDAKTFIAMRYWHPMSDAAAQAVRAYGADEIILLPLYPQYSTTTTQSSFDEWARAAHRAGLEALTRTVCCYPTEAGFINAEAKLLRAALAEAGRQTDAPVRVLFSAHGLPKRIIDKTGDPYPDQVRWGAEAIVGAMAEMGSPLKDWRISFQSRVGPLEWIGPATEDEIKLAGSEGIALVVLPLAFVSEHSETLVELDMEYRDVAVAAGVPAYVRVATVGTSDDFIDALVVLVRRACEGGANPDTTMRPCPANHRACPAAVSR